MTTAIRHTNGKIVWTQRGKQNWSTYALDADGARYTIDRFGKHWAIGYLPKGTPEHGPREQVPWLTGRHSLTTAKQAVAAHHAQLRRTA